MMAGAQRYAALCVGCHLFPGVTDTDPNELRFLFKDFTLGAIARAM
jgi:hypothetical protein